MRSEFPSSKQLALLRAGIPSAKHVYSELDRRRLLKLHTRGYVKITWGNVPYSYETTEKGVSLLGKNNDRH